MIKDDKSDRKDDKSDRKDKGNEVMIKDDN